MSLPKQVKSLCPECIQIIDASIYSENGKVLMKKECPKHGSFTDTIYSHVELYLKAEKIAFNDTFSLLRPNVNNHNGCPYSCGLCDLHKSYSCLVNIDLTNRCNLGCSVCFANASVKGYVYELTLDQVKQMLENIIRTNYPQVTHNIQFSGGEPTIHSQFIDCVRAAKELGYAQIQVATNGVKFAEDLEFVYRCREAGLTAAYLQFDGVGEEIYERIRGRKGLWELKQRAIENLRKADIGIALVPTIIKGVNDDQVGKILEYCIANADIIRGVSYQPVAFTGRIECGLRENGRYTLSDLAYDIEKQTGYAKAMEDWYPLSITFPITQLVSHWKGGKVLDITCHSDCGLGTMLLVNMRDRRVFSISSVIDIEALMQDIYNLLKKGVRFNSILALKLVRIFSKHRKQRIKGLSTLDLLKAIGEITDRISPSEWKLIFAAGMHFQDNYNYNLDRVQRCVIHYAAPNGRLYPFCTYNSGPVYREQIEKEYSIPLEEWRKLYGEETKTPLKPYISASTSVSS